MEVRANGENGKPVLSIRDVQKHYPGTVALNGVSLEVRRGEVVCVIGPSGSGKSTLLRCVKGLEPVDGGEIWISDRQVAGDRLPWHGRRPPVAVTASVGFVFQNFNLFPHLRAEENIMLAPVELKRMSRGEAREVAHGLLAKFGLADKARCHPAQLSGGQQQRLAIARALAMRPKLMLFDEVTSALDPEMTQEVLQAMRQLAAEGMTMVVVTHEMAFAREVAHEIGVMVDGRLVEVGPPQRVFEDPQHVRTHGFLAPFVGSFGRSRSGG
jgi:polar amino acid transport system ATP-binding protein